MEEDFIEEFELPVDEEQLEFDFDEEMFSDEKEDMGLYDEEWEG